MFKRELLIRVQNLDWLNCFVVNSLTCLLQENSFTLNCTARRKIQMVCNPKRLSENVGGGGVNVILIMYTYRRFPFLHNSSFSV